MKHVIFTLVVVFTFGTHSSLFSQCDSVYYHEFNDFAAYPYDYFQDVTNNNANANLRIRIYHSGTGNKIILDNPDATSTVRYGGWDFDLDSYASCTRPMGANDQYWQEGGYLAENGTLTVAAGTSYVPVRISVSGVYKFGWLKIRIAQNMDTVYVYAVAVDLRPSSAGFKSAQCDPNPPSYCATTGTEDISSGAVVLYPNPSAERIFIRSEEAVLKGVTVYDVLGNVAVQAQMTDGGINVSELPDGIYIAEVSTDHGTIRIRWQKGS